MISRKSGTSHLIFLAKIAISSSLLALLWTWFLRNRDILHEIQIVRPWYLLPAPGLVAASVYVRSVKWRLILRHIGISITTRQAIGSYLGGLAIGMLSPGRLGELGRALYLTLERDKAIACTKAALSDKALEFIAVCIWALGGTVVLFGFRQAALYSSIGVMIMLLGAIAALLLKWSRAFIIFHLHHKKLSVTSLLLSVFCFGCEWALYWCSFKLLGIDLPFAATSGVFSITTLAAVVPVSLGGTGIRELLAVILTRTFSVPPSSVVAVSLSVFVLANVLPATAGQVLNAYLPRIKTA